MSITTIYYKKHLEKYVKYNNILKLNQKKYFLLCENCFWMASTISTLKDIRLIRYKKSPVCISKVNRFLICEEN